MNVATIQKGDLWRMAREAAIHRPLTDSRVIEVAGSERGSFLNSLITNKVDDLDTGQGARAFLLNPTRGRVLADLLVCAAADALWLECLGGSGAVVTELLQRYYFGQDVEVGDRSQTFHVFSLQGPAAARALTGIGIEEPPSESVAHQDRVLFGSPGRVVRWSDTGAEGFHLWVAAEVVDDMRAWLVREEIPEVDDDTWDVLQIESGTAVFDRELNEHHIPLEAPIGDAIHHEKGCYPGQEVIARLHVRGRPARFLKGLRFEHGPPPERGSVLDAEGKTGAAEVTASGVSPELGPIAMAYVLRDYSEAGTRLMCDGHTATVHDLPLR